MGEVKYNRIQIVLYEFTITQLEFAAALGVDKNTVTRWCKNHNQPSLVQLREIAEFFRIDIRQLIEPTEWADQVGPTPFEIYREKKNASLKAKKAVRKKVKRKRI